MSFRRHLLFRIPALLNFGTSSLNLKSSAAINWTPCRNAGHSKWANIRHVKEAKDLARSKELTKIHQRIQVAMKEGGSPDPKTNSKLNSVIEDAKEAKVPLASITRMLENAAKSKSDAKSEIWAVKGPGRSIILVEIFTDNRKKLKDDLNIVLKRNKAIWTESTAVVNFKHVGLIHCTQFQGKSLDEDFLENATDHAIEAGAEDVNIAESPEHGKVFEFSASPSAFRKVKSHLTQAGYTVVYAETLFTPLTTVSVTEEELRYASTLCDKLLENPDVMNIYANIE